MPRHDKLFRHVLSLCLLASLAFAGCGPKAPQITTVTGRVTLDGQPVTNGTVLFDAVDKGFGVSALIQPDGIYTMKSQWGEGIPVGRYRVAITPPVPDQPKFGTKPVIESSVVPKKYHQPTTSGLIADVAVGGPPVDFSLKK